MWCKPVTVATCNNIVITSGLLQYIRNMFCLFKNYKIIAQDQNHYKPVVQFKELRFVYVAMYIYIGTEYEIVIYCVQLCSRYKKSIYKMGGK